MTKTLQVIGIILLLSITHWPTAAGTKSPVTGSKDLRPTHIDVDGDQNIIEKPSNRGFKERTTSLTLDEVQFISAVFDPVFLRRN